MRLFIKAFQEGEGHLQECAVEALGQIGGRETVSPLIVALSNQHWYVRHKAAKALGDCQDIRAIEPLVKALADQDKEVRHNAREALEKITHTWQDYESAVTEFKALTEALKNRESFVRTTAVNILGKIGEVRAYQYLKKVLKDPNRHVRMEAKQAIEKIRQRNQPFLQAFPHVICLQCSLRPVKLKYRFGFFYNQEGIVCRHCRSSSYLKKRGQ